MADLSAPRSGGASFTERVRQELARDLPQEPETRRSLLAAIVALIGSIHLRGEGELRIEVASRSGAVARAVFVLAQGELSSADVADARPALEVHAPGGVRASSRYIVSIREGATTLGRRLGRLDEAGRPAPLRADSLEELLSEPVRRRAFLRGAVLAAASFSRPGRAHHLEIAAPSEELAGIIAESVQVVVDHRPGVGAVGEGWRVVVKSGAAMDRLLAELGAEAALAERRDHRERATLRRRATRLANADAANLRRSVESARSQVRAVEEAVDRIGWEGLEASLRDVALARLANPEASLAEIGTLCDPPVGKSAVHRRIARIEELARDGRPGVGEDGSDGRGPSG